MSAGSKLFDSLIKNIKLSIHTNLPGRVVKYYASTKEADVELLFMTADNQGELDKYPMIERVPCLRHVGPLVVNDTVYLGVSERALDNLQKVPFDPDSSRTHDLRDCVIVGVFDI
jgi:hypothetical protein